MAPPGGLPAWRAALWTWPDLGDLAESGGCVPSLQAQSLSLLLHVIVNLNIVI